MEIIYKAIVGSKMHGLDTPESDEDVRIVYKKPLRLIISPFANDSSPSPKEESFELRHFAKLLTSGNPTVYEVIKSPLCSEDENSIKLKSLMNYAFDCKKILYAHIGYAESQIIRYLRVLYGLDESKWQINTLKRTPKAIVASYRVLAQCKQLLTSGDFEPKVKDYNVYLHDMLMDIKTMNLDKIDKPFIKMHLLSLEEEIFRLKEFFDTIPVEIKNKKANVFAIEDILMDFYTKQI